MSKLFSNSKFKYGRGYLILFIEFENNLPEKIEIGNNIFVLENKFHISIVNTKYINFLLNGVYEINENIVKKVLKVFENFIEKNKIEILDFKNEYFLIEDKKRNRKSIVQMVEMSNIKKLFQELEKEFEIEIPIQPTHNTIYTLGKNMGIGVNNYEQLLQGKKINLDKLC